MILCHIAVNNVL